MTQAPKRPIPGRIWTVFTLMVIAALLCLVLAVLLGTRLRSMGADRAGGREGYVQVTKHETAPPVTLEAEQMRALMDMLPGEEGGVSPTALQGEPAPLDMPNVEMLPTEVPAAAKPAKAAVEVSPITPLEVKPLPTSVRWQTNAVPVGATPGAPKLVIVIDDMGGQMDASRRAVAELPAGVTLSFFPWSAPGIALAREAKTDGHEIMIHMPMEAQPHGSTLPDPGPDTLRVGMTAPEIEERLRRNVAALSDLAVGLNNHMGSRFTEWEPGMRAVLTVLQEDGMLFLDSKTAAPTAVKAAAKGLALPVLSRDVFLDHVPTAEAVRAELQKAVLLARKRGSAIAIGHPLPVTLDVLRDELPRIVSSGVVLAPVSMLVTMP